MRVLLVHPGFPGQFGTLLAALARQGRHQLVFVTQDGQGALSHPGVTIVPYRHRHAGLRTQAEARGFDEAMRRAEAVAEVARGLRAAGFTPDIVLGHEGWGDTLNLGDVWPGVKQIGFREYFYHEAGSDVGCDPEFPVAAWQRPGVRAKNAVPALALLQGHQGVSPTVWQRAQYPGWARPGIRVIDDAVDLDRFRPDPAARTRPFHLDGATVAPGDELLTFVASSLEPYRGLHTLMRALPQLLARPRLRVAILGGVRAIYGPPPPRGTWWEWMLAELDGRIDRARLIGPGFAAPDAYAALLRRSDVHAYLSYPFFVSWSLREALASGCAVVAADTAPVREFVDARTGVLVPPLDPAATAAAIGALLDDAARRASLGRAARDWAERHLRPEVHVDRWRALILQVCGQDLNG